MLQDKRDSRWWEYYAVRYALGVGIGTPIVGLLWLRYRCVFHHTIRLDSPFHTAISALLWGAAGMAFCYIASAPMLTFHSTRRYLKRSNRSVNWLLYGVIGLASFAGTLALTGMGHHPRIQCTAAWAILSAIFGIQVFVLRKVLLNPDDTYQFYDQLEKNRPRLPELVESYRHLREHGNAVSIVLWELILAFILWSVKPNLNEEAIVIARIGVVLGIWLLPSSLAWLLGSALERHVSQSKSLIP